MTRSFIDSLNDIVTAIDDARSFTEALDLDDFQASKVKRILKDISSRPAD